jgi:thioredoxin reductase
MLLKSEGFASYIHDPGQEFSLARFCEQRRLPYKDIGLPVPIETFVEYGLAFQQRFAPHLETQQVVHLERDGSGFLLTLENGETAKASQVVVAVGICQFPHIPEELRSLAGPLFSHSSQHANLDGFRDRNVIVLGGGSSAVDLAVLLHRAGASVRLVARRATLHFAPAPTGRPRTIRERLRWPRSGLGAGWKSKACEDAPLLFHKLPSRFRLRAVREHLGPSSGWFVREHAEKFVPMLLGKQIVNAGQTGNGIWLRIADASGNEDLLEADHVVAATGYRVDLRRLGFFHKATLDEIRTIEHTPVLTSHFETSVPGLFFIGPAAANSFGPLLRFACGSRFASRRLTSYIAGRANGSGDV